MTVRFFSPEELQLVVMKAWDYAVSARFEVRSGKHSLPAQKLLEVYAVEAAHHASTLMEALDLTIRRR